MKDHPESPPSGKQPASRTGKAVSPSGVLVFTAVLLWLVLTITIFYVFHKPLPPEALERVRSALIDLAAAGWIVWIGIGIGRFFVPGGRLNIWERASLSGALGLGVLGLLFLAIIWAGIFSAAAAVVVGIVLTLFVTPPLVGGMRHFLQRKPLGIPPAGMFSMILAAFIAVSLLLSLGIALAPPLAWDALVYHFRIPQQYLAGHGMPLPGDSLFREMPQLVEMIYSAAVALTGRAETAAVLGWAFGVLTLVGLTGAARRWGLRHALLPAALLLAGDTLARSMGWGYVDWAAALFGIGAMCSLWNRESGGRWIVTAGVIAGFATGTKYTSGVLLAVLLLSVWSLRDRNRFLREAVLLLGGFLLVFGPWILRAWVFWGNPLPPLLDSGQAAMWKTAFFGRGPLEHGWLLAVPMPFLQSTIGREGGFPFDATIGPLLIAFLPGALRRIGGESTAGDFRRRSSWIAALVYWAVTGVGSIVALQFSQPRLFTVLFPAIALLSAYGFDRLWEIRLAKIRIGAVASVLVVLVMAFQAAGFVCGEAAGGTAEYFAGTLSRTEYLEENLGWYERAMETLRSLPEGSRILLLWEPRGFYCPAACREDSTIDRWYLLMRSGRTADEILAEWRGEGWTHLLVFDAGVEFERATRSEYSPSDWEQLECLLEALPIAERFGDGYTLYILK
jgi:hypothetical protein